MKRLLLTWLILSVILCTASCHKSNTDPTIVTKSQAVLDSITKGDFNSATVDFDPVMKSQMSSDQLRNVWQGIIQQCGVLKRECESRFTREAGFDTVFVPCEFEKITLDMKVVFNSDGKIGGLWFVPHIDADKTHYSSPVYVHKERFDDREVTIGGGKWKLPGTLTIPRSARPFPGIVLVHGSGPNDRDESLGANKPFRDLAEGLSSQGIAVLRYDKRTKVYSTRILQSIYKPTVKDEVIDDVLAAIKVLRRTKKIDPQRIFVLGHSLGGRLIPRIAKTDPSVAGVIVMAGGTRPMEDTLLDQAIYLFSLNGSPSADQEEQLDEIRRQVANVKSPSLSSSVPASSLPMGLPASYWLDLRGYNPAETAKSLDQPMMILQGGRDYQVTKVEYDGWLKSLSKRPSVTFKFYPNLNHLFMAGRGMSTPGEYNTRGPIPQAVIDDLVAWISAH
ncbi:alpha/beta fold hydrolase [bacterium]|nr:alpha/beta fold hydrolase [bacterium]